MPRRARSRSANSIAPAQPNAKRRSRRAPAWVIGALLAALTLLSLLMFDRPLIRGDGLAYYMWFTPIAVERSFDLSTAAAQFASVNEYQAFRYGPTGRWASAFSFGPAALLAPFYWLGSVWRDPPWVDAAHYFQWQAEPFHRSFTVMLGVNAVVVATTWLTWRTTLRLGVNAEIGAIAAIATLWGTPLLYYGSVEPFMAHAPGAFAIALATWLAIRPSPRWELVGLALSVATLMRWQLALSALPWAVLLAWRREWASLGRLVVGVGALAWLAPLSWWWMYGAFTAVPAAEQNMRPFLTGPVFLFDVALSPERGWLVWSPVAGLGSLGLVWLGRRAPAVAAPLLGAVAAQLLMNASVTEWQAGWSFGMRRMTDLYPIYVIGVAALVGLTTGVTRLVAWLAVTVASLWGVLALVAHLSYINAVAGSGGPIGVELDHLLGSRLGPRVALDAIVTHYGPWAWSRPGP